jgi:hypothetical protein
MKGGMNHRQMGSESRYHVVKLVKQKQHEQEGGKQVMGRERSDHNTQAA